MIVTAFSLTNVLSLKRCQNEKAFKVFYEITNRLNTNEQKLKTKISCFSTTIRHYLLQDKVNLKQTERSNFTLLYRAQKIRFNLAEKLIEEEKELVEKPKLEKKKTKYKRIKKRKRYGYK